MNFKVFESDELIEKKDEPLFMMNLLENKESMLKLVSLDKHAEIPPHTSAVDVCVYVIDGEIEIVFNQIDNCICETCHCESFDEKEEIEKRFKIKKGQFFFFEKDYMHFVKALKDSKFLVIRI